MTGSVRPGGRTDRRLAALAAAPVSYSEVGATRGPLPSGYHHVERRSVLGAGTATFHRAARALAGWAMHRGAGLHVTATAPRADTGVLVLLTVGWRGVGLTAPCRVVYTVAEPDRRGFAYGTLPGHPECGEEAFLIRHAADDRVWFDIRAFSRPGSRLTRLAPPVNRRVQRHITDRYVRALRRATLT